MFTFLSNKATHTDVFDFVGINCVFVLSHPPPPPPSNLSILSQEKALNEHISVGIDY